MQEDDVKYIVKSWSSRPPDAVDIKNLRGFKKGLDKFTEEKSTESY